MTAGFRGGRRGRARAAGFPAWLALVDAGVSARRGLDEALPRPMVAVVVRERCSGCGRCVETCLQGALRLGQVACVDASSCTGCGACVAECPSEALVLGRRPTAAAEGLRR